MPAKLFGIGVGPGDSELLTIKALKAIEKCEIIAIPKSGEKESAAYTVIREYLGNKELVECRFEMGMSMEKRKEARNIAASAIVKYLEKGHNVGFVTLGDPTTYSTYMYIHEIITKKGHEAEIIPGITSYSAAAAAFGIALCEDSEPLIIIPARTGDNIDELLNYPGNKVIMKSGKNLGLVLERLKELGHGNNVYIAAQVTMDGQRLFGDIEEYERSAATGYFTTAIVKQPLE